MDIDNKKIMLNIKNSKTKYDYKIMWLKTYIANIENYIIGH